MRFYFTLLFFLLSSFITGVGFLLCVYMPVEELLVKHNISQRYINASMILVILLWFLTSLLTTYVYKKKSLKVKNTSRFSWISMLLLLAGSVTIFMLLLNTSVPLISKARILAQEYCNRFTFGSYPGEGNLKPLAQSDELSEHIYPDELEGGNLTYYRSGNVILGPYPTDKEWSNFILGGKVTEILSLLDERSQEEAALIEKEKKTCSDMNIKLNIINLDRTEKGYELPDSIKDKISTSLDRVYVHSFRVDDRIKTVDSYLKEKAADKIGAKLSDSTLNARIYGIREDSLSFLKEKVEFEYISGKLIIGTMPGPDEMMQLTQNGISTFILLTGRDKKSKDEIKKIQRKIESMSLSFIELSYDAGYTNTINRELIREANPCYLIVPEPSMHQVVREVRKTKLTD